MLQKTTPAQKLLLQHLANISSSGQYIVPASDWVKKLLNVTEGLTPEEIEYIKNLDWKPGRISEGELRERLRKALANRGKKSSPKSKDHTTKPTSKKVREGEDGGTSSDAGKITDKNQGASERRSGTKPPSGTKGLSKDITDKVTDPPAGSNRNIKGKFKFKILSGMSKLSILKPNDVVRCRILVNDMGRSFELEGVSITFLSRTDTELISPSGAKYIHTIFNIYFTKDFWSEKYNFYGRGGDVNESITYDFGFKKVN